MSVLVEPPAVIDHPSGFLLLCLRNRRFHVDGIPGFLAYREQGRHLVVFGGVHAPEAFQAPLLDAFLVHVAAARRRLLVVQLRESQAALFLERGFTVNQLGTSFALTLRGWSLAGGRKMRLRNKLQRARRAGLSVVELGREAPRDATAFAELRAISAEWLAAKRRPELEFMVGELGEPEDAERRIFVAADGSGRAVAFITYVPAWGGRPGWLHDLSRRRPTAPPGALELVNLCAIERFVSEGAAYLHFGFTPFVVDGTEPVGANRLAARAVRALARWGGMIYPAQSQAEYKLKWQPDVLEREYIAARPLSLRAVLDLLVLTRAV